MLFWPLQVDSFPVLIDLVLLPVFSIDQLEKMPPVISWEGEIPDESRINDFKQQLHEFTAEESSDFPVVATLWDTPLDREKVVQSENYVFLCKVKDGILCLVPDDALDIHKLIWMWDAEPVTVNFLSATNLRNAMSS